MNATIESITQHALVLPPEQRLKLANVLLMSVDPDSEHEPGAEEAWRAEIIRRMERFHAGLSKTIPATEVFARFNREFKK